MFCEYKRRETNKKKETLMESKRDIRSTDSPSIIIISIIIIISQEPELCSLRNRKQEKKKSKTKKKETAQMTENGAKK